MSGYGMARDKAYRKRRLSEIRHVQRPASATGKPNVRGWQQLAAKFGELGWTVQRGGERLVAA